MESTRQNGLALPWWVRAIALVGVPSAIALFLVYAQVSLASANTEELARHRQSFLQIQHTVELTHRDLQTHLNTSAQQLTRIERYLRIICLNVARTPGDRSDCLLVQ